MLSTSGRREVLRRPALIVIVVSLLCVSHAKSQPYAYVTNAASATVSIIDTRTDKVSSTFEAGDKPRGIATSVDGARLYSAHQTGTLIERDLYQDKASARVALGASARAVRRSPAGKLLAVMLDGGGSIALVDMPMLRVTKTVRIGDKSAGHAAFSPDGRWIYADADGDSVAVIDVAKGAVIKSIKVGGDPRGIAFLPDGRRAYVAVAATGELVVIDVPRHAVVARVKSKAKPGEVAVHPDGKRVFVSAATGGKVQVLDARSDRFIADIAVGAGPSDMAFTTDGSKLYVACRLANEVSVIDASTYERIGRVAVAQPSAIVIANRPSLPRDGG